MISKYLLDARPVKFRYCVLMKTRRFSVRYVHYSSAWVQLLHTHEGRVGASVNRPLLAYLISKQNVQAEDCRRCETYPDVVN